MSDEKLEGAEAPMAADDTEGQKQRRLAEDDAEGQKKRGGLGLAADDTEGHRSKKQ